MFVLPLYLIGETIANNPQMFERETLTWF